MIFGTHDLYELLQTDMLSDRCQVVFCIHDLDLITVVSVKKSRPENLAKNGRHLKCDT